MCRLIVEIVQGALREGLDQIILGDFLNFGCEEDNRLTSFFKSKGFFQLIQQPNYSSGRTLDHCYVSHKEMVEKGVGPSSPGARLGTPPRSATFNKGLWELLKGLPEGLREVC